METQKIITIDSSSDSIIYICKKDQRMSKLIETIGPISYEIHSNYYEFLIAQIINQMLSNKAASSIFSKLDALCDGGITAEKITNLSDIELKSVGMSMFKVGYIRNLTSAIMNHQIPFDKFLTMEDSEIIQQLTKIRGIGTWSAKMFLIFALDRQNVIPYEDVAFLQGYKWLYATEDTSVDSIKKRSKKWEPYSSIAARYLYRALDLGMTKLNNPF